MAKTNKKKSTQKREQGKERERKEEPFRPTCFNDRWLDSRGPVDPPPKVANWGNLWSFFGQAGQRLGMRLGLIVGKVGTIRTKKGTVSEDF